MGSRVIFEDIELWLCRYLRRVLARTELHISNRFPDPVPPWCIVVRYDGGLSGMVTEDAAVGVTIIGPATDISGREIAALSRQVHMHLRYCWQDPDGPAVAAEVGGPVRIPGSDRPERYMTASIRIVGSPA